MELKKKIKALGWLVAAMAIMLALVGVFGAVFSWITGVDVIKCSVGVLAFFVGAVIWRLFVLDFFDGWR